MNLHKQKGITTQLFLLIKTWTLIKQTENQYMQYKEKKK